MTVKYYIEQRKAWELMENGDIDRMCIDGFKSIAITIDCHSRNVSIYGVNYADEEELLDDCAYAYIPSLEDAAEEFRICDQYASNVEIAEYTNLSALVPYEWALSALDEYRTPEDEETYIDITEKELRETIEAIRLAYYISIEES